MDLIIVAAGKGSRFKGEIPKPLAKTVNGLPNVFNTALVLGECFDNIIITISKCHREVYINELAKLYDMYPSDQYLEHPVQKIRIVDIESGYGSGHAVMMSLEKASILQSYAVLTWGDAIFTNDKLVVDMLDLAKYTSFNMLIPVAKESDPYLHIFIDEYSNCTGLSFEKIENGYHDQSTFLVNISKTSLALHDYHVQFWNDVEGKYNTDNGEFGFLYVIETMAESGNHPLAYETNYPIKSYNSVKELAEIANSCSFDHIVPISAELCLD